MHRHGISYKNLYKYDFVNLYENMHSPSKPKYISYRNSNKNFLNTEYQNTNKTQTNYNKYEGNDLMLEAKKNIDKNEDCVKQMNKLSLYAKVATIRDRQLKEHEMMEDLYKKKEKK